MSNWSLPVITSLYTDFLAYLKDRDLDVAKALDPAKVTVTNPVTDMVRWNSANRFWEIYNGSSWVPLASYFAVEVGAFTGDVTKSAGSSALALTNNVVTNSKLRDSAATSVIGRATNSSGDPDDIVAAVDDRVLTRIAGVLAFTQLTAGMFPASEKFAAGTKMVFYQANAPTGWTGVALSDRVLRVVSVGGSGGTGGGAVGFSTWAGTTTSAAAAPGSTDGFTLTTNEMPVHTHTASGGTTDSQGSHAHTLPLPFGGGGGSNYSVDITGADTDPPGAAPNTSAAGSHAHNINALTLNNTGGGAAHAHAHSATHSHTLNNTNMLYSDVIVASKD